MPGLSFMVDETHGYRPAEELLAHLGAGSAELRLRA